MNDAENQIPRDTRTQAPEIRLQCLGGNPAPSPVIEGWRRFLSFPEAAGKAFQRILEPALKEPADPRNRERVETFCKEHGLSEEDVLAAIRSCDLLFRQASALDLAGEAFRRDLTALSEGRPEAIEIIASRYDAVKSDLRAAIVQESLADHGKILVGLDWRVDTVNASDRGTRLNTNVVFLTLRYRDGNRLERFTLQLTPEALKQLKQFTDRLDNPPQPARPGAPFPGMPPVPGSSKNS